MKNSIDDIIRSFTRDELRQFKYFISRNGNSDKKKDLDLIEQIRKNNVQKEPRSNAQLQIRKRLKTSLTHFALLENLRYDQASEINSLIEMSKYLFRKNMHEHAWNCLFRAEKLAIRNEEYEFLDFIYGIQVSYSSIVYMPGIMEQSIPDIISNRNNNFELAKMHGDANAAYAQLLYKIREHANSPRPDMDHLVAGVLREYNLNDQLYKNPKIYLRITQIVGKSLHENKEFARLKAYVLNSYRIMSEKKMLNKFATDSVMEIIFFICTSAIKTRDFKTCEKFLHLYKQYAETVKMQHDLYLTYTITFTVNIVDLYLCTNRLQDAKDSMLALYKKHSGQNSSAKIYFLLRLNLIAIHFKCEEYRKCIRIYNDTIQQPTDRLLKIGGLEIVIYTELYGAMIHYENDDADYARDLLKKFRQKYAGRLAKGLMKREFMFVRIMEHLINNPSYINTEAFKKHLARFSALKNYIPGDKEYISLNAWLHSKAQRTSYYACFLQLVTAAS